MSWARRITTGVLAMCLLAAPGALAEPPADPPRSPPTPKAPCAKGRIVKVKPREQKKKVRKAASPAELKELLEPLLLVTRGSSDPACLQRQEAPDVTLDVFRARILSADKEDFVLQARGTVCDQGILIGSVLHPLAEADTFCAIPLPFLPGDTDQTTGTITFGFENVTDAVRQVFKVESTRENGRVTEYETSWWEAQEGELRPIYSAFSADYIGWTSGSVSSKVSFVGSTYPRELRLEESNESCGRLVDMPSGATVHASGCTRADNEVRLCYQKNTEPGSGGGFKYLPCAGAR